MSSNPKVTVDVREIPPPQKHPTIFQTFDNLSSGEAMLLINDHDPKPLYYQMSAEMPDAFEWEYIETGSEVWQVQITKK